MSPPTTDSSTTETDAAPRGKTLGGKLLAIVGVAISCAYLANLGFGAAFEIPDFIPGIGNLDEVFFTGLLLTSLGYLGIPLIPNFRAAGNPLRIEGPKR